MVDIGTIAELFKLLRTTIPIDSGESIEKKNYLAIFKLYLTKQMIFNQNKKASKFISVNCFC